MVLLESGTVPTDRRTVERKIMQVENYVNHRYDTQYHHRSSVKKNVVTSSFDCQNVSNEATQYQRSTKTVDCQEYYKAWLSYGNARAIETANSNTAVNAMESTGAVSISETEDEGEFLGLTMIPEEGQSVTYGMRAMLSDKSTPDNPIVQVVSNLGGEKVIYNVEVNKVNPHHATQLEMFALLSYTDKMGITDGGTFGSHQQLQVYGENASSIGYCGCLSGGNVFVNEKFDWIAMIEKMIQVYMDAGIEKQAEDCRTLFENMEGLTGTGVAEPKELKDYAKILEEKMNEIMKKIQNGDTEPTYQIGAQSFTEKEWDELLDQFDDAEEEIQELLKEEFARKKEEEAKTQMTDMFGTHI